MTSSNRGGRPSKREFILEKAELLVQERGASHLTFDALTEKTGISKGGLLYHFASKEALIMAMLERYIEAREQRTAAILAKGEIKGPDADLKAMIIAELSEPHEMLAVDSAILAAVASNPSLLDPIKHKHAELSARLDNSKVGGARARVAWKATIGHRLMRQLGLIECETEAQCAEFGKEIVALLDEDTYSADKRG